MFSDCLKGFNISFLVLLLMVFSGCDELGLLNNLPDDPQIRVILIDSLVNPGMKINIHVDAEENIPDKVSSRLEGISDVSLELVLDRSGADGVITIPDTIEDGLYTLVSEAWLDDELLSEDRRDIFILHGEWTINSLEIFPPQSVPGGVFYARVLLDIPGNSNPLIRWIQDDVVVSEGLLSEGVDAVVLNAGRNSGVQPLRVELYYPDSALPLRSFSTDLYVAESIPAGKDNLFPPESYIFLQHFDGKLDGKPKVRGMPRPVNTSNGMGFFFNTGDSIEWENLSLSLGDEGEWEPFSLTVGILLEDGGRLLELDSEDYSLSLSFSKEDGKIYLYLGDDNRYVSSLSLPDSDKSAAAVTVSFQPDEEGLNLIWLIDGDTRSVDRWSPLPEPPVIINRISLGGDDGFSGTVTELGLRFPGMEPDRFVFYRDTDENGLVVEGFEDSEFLSRIEINPEMMVEKGALLLPPSSSVRFPSGGGGELAFDIFPPEQSLSLTLYNPETGKVSDKLGITGEISDYSGNRIIIPLEKESGITDNIVDAMYELRTSSRNTSNLRLEYIVVNRE